MSETKTSPHPEDSHPLLALGRKMKEHDWVFDIDGNSLYTGSQGERAQYDIAVVWEHDLSLVHMACVLELGLEDAETPAGIQYLLGEINGRLFVGHFEYRPEDKGVVFRHGLYIVEGETWTGSLLLVLHTAITTCEMYAPVFQKVAAGGRAAEELQRLFSEHETKTKWEDMPVQGSA